jgi:hypothetical protein
MDQTISTSLARTIVDLTLGCGYFMVCYSEIAAELKIGEEAPIVANVRGIGIPMIVLNETDKITASIGLPGLSEADLCMVKGFMVPWLSEHGDITVLDDNKGHPVLRFSLQK